MTEDQQVEELVLQWQELAAAGTSVSAEYLCRTSPHLRSKVEERIRLLQQMDDFIASVTPASYRAAESSTVDTLRRFGRYVLLEEIGEGGMGKVYRARDESLRREVALKTIRKDIQRDPEARARFLREARALAGLEHPHLPVIYEVGEEAGVSFLAMQLLRGETLEQRLQRLGKLPLAAALRLGQETCQALATAHQRGLTHRDVKPSNLWLESGSESVKVLDFGLVQSSDDQSKLTRTGYLVGTPAYMAPEQTAGLSVDARADLFSLGCVLFEAMSGRSWFRRKDPLATLRAIELEKPPRLSTLVDGVPHDFDRLLAQLLEKEPAKRPSSAVETAERLRRIEDELRRGGRRPIYRRLAVLLLAACVGGVALAVGAFVWRNCGREVPQIAVNANAGKAFAVLASEGPSKYFSTLAEAIEATPAGGTIEIQSTGPFQFDRTVGVEKPVRIRAAVGIVPVVDLRYDKTPKAHGGLKVLAHCILEGLDLRYTADPEGKILHAIEISNASLMLAHSRLMVHGPSNGILCGGGRCEIRNSLLIAPEWGPVVTVPREELSRVAITESVLAGYSILTLYVPDKAPHHMSVELSKSTLVTDGYAALIRIGDAAFSKFDPPALDITAARSVVLGKTPNMVAIECYQTSDMLEPGKAVSLLPKLMHWKEKNNRYPQANFVNLVDRRGKSQKFVENGMLLETLEQWQTLWNSAKDGCTVGNVQILPEPNRLLRDAPEKLKPEDFGVAQVDGKSASEFANVAGADVRDLGPGPSYDRWRQSPDYANWETKVARMLRPQK